MRARVRAVIVSMRETTAFPILSEQKREERPRTGEGPPLLGSWKNTLTHAFAHAPSPNFAFTLGEVLFSSAGNRAALHQTPCLRSNCATNMNNSRCFGHNKGNFKCSKTTWWTQGKTQRYKAVFPLCLSTPPLSAKKHGDLIFQSDFFDGFLVFCAGFGKRRAHQIVVNFENTIRQWKKGFVSGSDGCRSQTLMFTGLLLDYYSFYFSSWRIPSTGPFRFRSERERHAVVCTSLFIPLSSVLPKCKFHRVRLLEVLIRLL